MDTHISNDILAQKRSAVVEAFLSFDFRKTNKNKISQDDFSPKIEYITSTMRLEGEPVTSEDVRRILKVP